MMLFRTSALSILCAIQALAQEIVPELSFGTKGAISPNSFSIPGWKIDGEGHKPQLLSDKVILTPPYGGGKRGSLWTEKKSTQTNWEVALDFRAGGTEHGKGSLVLWYVKDGNTAVGASSIYTVGKFDGLALVIDQVGGVQKIRGFLNDGSTDYKHNQNVDSLPFGHCDYVYRNLGRPSKLVVKSNEGGLEVVVDEKPCFGTPKVVLPTNYNFGLTAASADPPDSFEAFRFQVSHDLKFSGGGTQQMRMSNAGANTRTDADASTDKKSGDPFTPDTEAYHHFDKRLHAIESAMTGMFAELSKYTASEETRYAEILQLLKSGQSANAAGAGAAIGNLESKLSNLDRSLSILSGDLKSNLNHDEKFAQISRQLQDTHEGLTHHMGSTIRQYMLNHTPRIGFIVFSFMAFQSCCLAVLLWQKYRKSTMPKKFL